MSIKEIYSERILLDAANMARQGRCPRDILGFSADPELVNQRDAPGVEELACEIARIAGLMPGFEHTTGIGETIARLEIAFPGSILIV